MARKLKAKPQDLLLILFAITIAIIIAVIIFIIVFAIVLMTNALYKKIGRSTSAQLLAPSNQSGKARPEKCKLNAWLGNHF